MASNYSDWTVSRLEKEKAKIEKAIQSKEGKERKRALADVTAAAKKNGFDVKELLADLGIGVGSTEKKVRSKKVAGRRRTGKVAPKYRNPDDPKVTWSGRGRKPKWIEAEIAKNGSPDKLAIR